MGRRIDKLPNGKYAVWSTIVDDYIMTDVTPEEIIVKYVEDATEDITTSVMRQVEKLG